METQQQQRTGLQRIVRLDKAFKLAEQWVNSMSKAEDDESTSAEPVGRQNRLGLGAKITRQYKFGASNDPVERRLHAKLEAGKRRAAKNNEESSTPNPKDTRDDDPDKDEEDEEIESRTSAFAKKRAGPPAPSFQVKKKQK